VPTGVVSPRAVTVTAGAALAMRVATGSSSGCVVEQAASPKQARHDMQCR